MDDQPRFFADCQARVAVDLISGTWSMVVLYALADGPVRPGDLRTQIGGISQKVLTTTLRRLERNGLVQRRRYAEAPPRVEYSLTTPGEDLLVPIRALGDWADQHAESLYADADADVDVEAEADVDIGVEAEADAGTRDRDSA